MLSTTEVQILDAFSAFGAVERVKKIKDYAFVHFQSREDSHKAMEAMNGESVGNAWRVSNAWSNHTYLTHPFLHMQG